MLRPGEIAVGEGYERPLRGFGPLSWYMRWYLRHRPAAEAPDVLAQLGPGPFPRLLDVGCATGIWLADVYGRGHGHALLAGADVGERFVAEARARLAGVVGPETQVRVERCSGTDMPFADGSFDAIMANGMVKHLGEEDFASFLREVERLLAPGGRVSMWDFGRPIMKIPDVEVKNPALSLKDCTMRTGEDFVALLTDAGFTDVRAYALKRPWRMPVTLEGAAATRP